MRETKRRQYNGWNDLDECMILDVLLNYRLDMGVFIEFLKPLNFCEEVIIE